MILRARKNVSVDNVERQRVSLLAQAQTVYGIKSVPTDITHGITELNILVKQVLVYSEEAFNRNGESFIAHNCVGFLSEDSSLPDKFLTKKEAGEKISGILFVPLFKANTNLKDGVYKPNQLVWREWTNEGNLSFIAEEVSQEA